jgi:Zn-dependent M28 family amino/carboxypeptidase
MKLIKTDMKLLKKNIITILKKRKKIIKNCKRIIYTLSSKIGERAYTNQTNLEKAKIFIKDYIQKLDGQLKEHTFIANKKKASNIIFEIEGNKHPQNIILVGAHYDTIEGSQGANDNASGIAALLEVYRILKSRQIKNTLRFLAFSHEEPPCFGSSNMGSMHYAKRCVKKKEKIKQMISFDMLGWGSIFHKQKYPFKYMEENYPKHGNFLCVASLPSSAKHAFSWKKIFNKYSHKKMFEFIAPASISGIHQSDHYSFYKHGYPAILVTDSGFYRSKLYHTKEDTYDKINYQFLANNINSISQTLLELANTEE